MPDFRLRATIVSGTGSFEAVVTDDDLASLRTTHGVNSHGLGLLAILWVSLLADSPVDHSLKPKRVYSRFLRSFLKDPIQLIKSFASLYDRLTTSVTLSNGDISIDEFIEEFKDTPIFKEYHEFYKTRDPLIFKYISSFLLFGKKYYYEDDTFNETAFRGWLEVEDRLRTTEFTDRYLDDIREIITWMLRYFDDTSFLPKHGPGAVAEASAKRSYSLKNDTLTQNLIAPEFSDICEWDVFHPHILTMLTSGSDMANDKISRLKFVPKDIGKSRSICMEPVAYQWLQQGVRLWVEDALRQSMGKHIPLTDQNVNREMARFGSRTARVDTIDLSSASDSVHSALVGRVFPEYVLRYLFDTRTTRTLAHDGTVIEMQKFAPMGSALCFPIQSIIYAAVVIHSSLSWHFGQNAGSFLNIDRSTMDRYYHDTYGLKKLASFSIFGDDIICDSRITSAVIDNLSRLGFSVNTGKSFTGSSAFRESCGGYYLNGVDVTPLRAKLGKIDSTIPVRTLASVIDLANRAYEFGYLTLRRQLIRTALYYPISGVYDRYHNGKQVNQILFSDDPDASFALFSPHPINKHLQRRSFDEGVVTKDTRFWYQRDELKSLDIFPADPDVRREVDDWYWHIVWWRSCLGNAEAEAFAPEEIPRETRPGWRWTSCPG